MEDICLRVTGQSNYLVEFDNSGYNKGRLATIEFDGGITYVSFSESEIGGRNASFQSFPTALVTYYREQNSNKRIFFYFLSASGNFNTSYFRFMYRLMKTAGTEFLNESDYLMYPVVSFTAVEDIIAHKNLVRGRNRSNNSTYITLSENDVVQIYGKTYGANKYETVLLCLAIPEITRRRIELYEIQERELKILPELARGVILAMGRITIISSDLTLEREEYEENNSLRSPAFIYNLLEKLGDKKCALCDCEIPQLIQGAHVWPVVSIKVINNISQEQKLQSAVDGDNGIWLCNNHHKLFDINLFLIDEQGRIKHRSSMREIDESYIVHITGSYQIKEDVLTPAFLHYLEKRNSVLDEQAFSFIDWERYKSN